MKFPHYYAIPLHFHSFSVETGSDIMFVIVCFRFVTQRHLSPGRLIDDTEVVKDGQDGGQGGEAELGGDPYKVV